MITQELIDEAKQKYPVGTKLKNCLHGWVQDAEKGIIEETVCAKPDPMEKTMWVCGNFYYLCIYDKGVWAETVNNSSEEYEIF